jgi:2-methylisocitrate lyase-like PEP mutase family enzyme
MEEVRAIPKKIQGPCLLNVVQGGKTPVVRLKDAEAMGYKIAILPGLLLRAAVQAFDQALDSVKTHHVAPDYLNNTSPQQNFRRFGADEWDAIRSKYALEDKG